MDEIKDPLRMSDFKNLHGGKRLFVIGNGPSLKEGQLEKLEGRHTIAMNNIADYWTETMPETKWRPQYYYNSTMQAIRYRGWLDKANLAVDEAHIAFIRTHSPIKDARNVVRFNFIGPRCKNCSEPVPKFSLECDEWVANYRMSMWGVSQIANFMGFQELILLGFDLGFKPWTEEQKKTEEDPNHFSKKYAGDFQWSPYLARRENFYHYHAHIELTHAFKELGIRAYNATIGGELEVWPRIDLDEVLDTPEFGRLI